MNEMQGSRRLTAFVVDCLVFLALAIALLLPLTWIDADRFRIGSPLPEIFEESTTRTKGGKTTAAMSGTWTSAICATPSPVPQSLLDPIAPQMPRRVLVCADSFMGIASGHTAYVNYMRVSQTVTGMQGDSQVIVAKLGTPDVFTAPTDAAGNPVRALFPLGLMTFGMMWAVSVMGWRTPGKMLAGLRVESLGGTCRACREGRRLAPLILAGAFALVTGLFGAEISASATLQWAVLGLQVAFWLFVLWYYALPFVTNTGRARYDLATKFRVVLA
jgi:uncharacterized RDD family membrane protein YckC